MGVSIFINQCIMTAESLPDPELVEVFDPAESFSGRQAADVVVFFPAECPGLDISGGAGGFEGCVEGGAATDYIAMVKRAAVVAGCTPGEHSCVPSID